MTDSIEQKIDKLMVMMDKLVMEDKGQNRPFKPKVYQSNRGRGQTHVSDTSVSDTLHVYT